MSYIKPMIEKASADSMITPAACTSGFSCPKTFNCGSYSCKNNFKCGNW
ncbi:hypothetical protein [Paenibacillus riograndensis]|uniref:Uncharacterized protein n=1 Tax=Paenibacillus riograndensis SBR5 TaxID=1073571 RepID=A0A0E4CXP1_9BACL|nr:hypothetical protein [Paenibacillus riograndensis]CQR56605.1 hypothetical protein PRIO_4203 [Paenibacillus riograndensis SBR5]